MSKKIAVKEVGKTINLGLPFKIFPQKVEAKSDGEILLVANLISLTPGSLSLDVSPDRKTLYVHAMFVDDPDAVRQELKHGLERRVMEALDG